MESIQLPALYKKTSSIIILLIFFFPIGLVLMWKYAQWDKKVKWAISLLGILILLVGMGTKPQSNKHEPAANVKVELPKKQIPYEILRRWTIPNGGEGKVILISPEYFNTNDMPLLGERLRDDTRGDRNAFIFVYTDRKAAEMREQALSDDLAEKNWDFYEKHYVGDYTKNGNSGFNEFDIYYNGVSNKFTTIKY